MGSRRAAVCRVHMTSRARFSAKPTHTSWYAKRFGPGWGSRWVAVGYTFNVSALLIWQLADETSPLGGHVCVQAFAAGALPWLVWGARGSQVHNWLQCLMRGAVPMLAVNTYLYWLHPAYNVGLWVLTDPRDTRLKDEVKQSVMFDSMRSMYVYCEKWRHVAMHTLLEIRLERRLQEGATLRPYEIDMVDVHEEVTKMREQFDDEVRQLGWPPREEAATELGKDWITWRNSLWGGKLDENEAFFDEISSTAGPEEKLRLECRRQRATLMANAVDGITVHEQRRFAHFWAAETLFHYGRAEKYVNKRIEGHAAHALTADYGIVQTRQAKEIAKDFRKIYASQFDIRKQEVEEQQRASKLSKT